MPKVVVGMSGGVDSAVAAYLLKKSGYEVIGITLRVWESADGTESRCCEIDDARTVSWKLGTRYYPMNCTTQFRENVIKPFIEDYTSGRTPNPCIICNRSVKFDRLLYLKKVLKADFIATGHYANVVRLDNGRYTLKKALHSKKDQTYMLYALTQEQVAATMMPIGNLTKSEVRSLAREAGFTVAEKPDSQELCFISEGSYADYIEKQGIAAVWGPGNFIDEDGHVLGLHKGIIHYTVGQRKGLGLSLGYPAYVKEIRNSGNEVVIGREHDLYTRTVICEDINLMSIASLKEKMRCTVKIRYQHAGQEAVIESAGDNCVRICFDDPVRAAAPGQAAVFYDQDDCLIGGGVISEVVF